MMAEEDARHGTDLLLKMTRDWQGLVLTDLAGTRTGDLELISGKANLIQAIRIRLATRQGELAEIGHPEYGSRLDTVIGEPNTEDTHRIIESLVRDALAQEPRIGEILSVEATADKLHKDCVNITVHLRTAEGREELRITYPFYLEERAEL
jgi:phage baseplate assembly protein W